MFEFESIAILCPLSLSSSTSGRAEDKLVHLSQIIDRPQTGGTLDEEKTGCTSDI